MNCLDKLPDDMKWNVIKFMRHPLAEVFLEASADMTYLDESYHCIHGLSFAFNWFHEKMYQRQAALREQNLPKELEKQLFRGITLNWGLYATGKDINI